MEKLSVYILALVIVFISCILLAWPVQWLWNNCLVNAVDGIHTITFWQALGLGLLCSILFKNSTNNIKN